MSRLWIAGMVALALGGCAKNEPFVGGAARVVSESEMLPPSGEDLAQGSSPYLVGPFDKLDIRVFGVEELSGEVQADASGSIQVPLVGRVNATGMTPAQLSQFIATQLRGRYLRDPQVTVNLKEATSRTFTVDGQVTEPGIYPVVGNMSLMRAVATAKGASEFAKLDDVVVFRTVGGQSMAALYNLGAIRRGVYADPKIYPNDIVVVGDSKGRRLFKDILTAAPALLTPLVILLQ